MRHFASVALAALTAFGAVSAQTTQIKQDTFEVAAIHPAPLPPGGLPPTPCLGGFQLTGGRVAITGATVYRLVSLAYGMPCAAASNLDLISGPEWLRKELFSIQATLPPGAPAYNFQQLQNDEAPALQAMLRALLADRFQLTLHRAPKDTPIYNVYFVKPGRVTLSADQTKPSEAANPMAFPYAVRNDPAAGTIWVAAKAIPIRSLLTAGQGRDGRFIVDKTGLRGLYDIEPITIDVAPLPEGVSSWPRMMNGLGFKLESVRGPVDSIVIDRIERPTEN